MSGPKQLREYPWICLKSKQLNACTFRKMHNLRFFKFYSSRYGENMNKVHNFQALESVFTKLWYLEWHGCPFKSLSSIIHPKNLVSLEIPRSSIKQLWNDYSFIRKL